MWRLSAAVVVAAALLAAASAQTNPFPGTETQSAQANYSLPKDHALHLNAPLYKKNNDYMECGYTAAAAALIDCVPSADCGWLLCNRRLT